MAGDALAENEINVLPTKELFIEFLTKDIKIQRAIIDLVDNCLDGAKRLRPFGDYRGLEIDIRLDGDGFEISDNCGGIGIETARLSAFRLGRPKDTKTPSTPGSVGQFGIGMKRAIFKIGKKFEVLSKTTHDHFQLSIDIDQWMAQPDEWKFTFSATGNHTVPESETGTVIRVERLNPDIAAVFANEIERNGIKREIEVAHQANMERGIAIHFNNIQINKIPVDIVASDNLKPARLDKTISLNGKNVKVQVIAGVGESSPQKAGWYIYCNGRLVLEADQSYQTGWGDSSDTKVPKYHNQFSRFRGYVLFESEDTSLLPWNTTKTGLDTDAALFKKIRQDMVSAMRPIISFLNKLDNEINEEEQPLHTIAEEARPIRLADIGPRAYFQFPENPAQIKTKQTRISFLKPTDDVKKVRHKLGVTNSTKVGEGVFDYYYKAHFSND